MSDTLRTKGYRCIVCGEHSFFLYKYEYGVDEPIGMTTPDKYFSREYRCPLCRTAINIATIVDTLDIDELLRKDIEWLENQR